MQEQATLFIYFYLKSSCFIFEKQEQAALNLKLRTGYFRLKMYIRTSCFKLHDSQTTKCTKILRPVCKVRTS